MKHYLVIAQEKVSSDRGDIYVNHTKHITDNLEEAEAKCDLLNSTLNEKFKSRVVLFINALYPTDFPSQKFIYGECWILSDSVN